jgi:hypothetical protein
LTGATGATGPPVTFQGIWSNLTTYVSGDAVFFSGSSYISLSSGNIGNTPTGGLPWMLLAQQGTTGSTGATGATGAAGAQGPTGLTGATGAAGANGAQGLTGLTGATGAAGTNGPGQLYSGNFQGAFNSTNYGAINGGTGSATYAVVQTLMPGACTFNALYFNVAPTASASAQAVSATLYKNGSSTALTCSASASGTVNTAATCSDTSNSVSVNAGDTVAWGISQTNTMPTFRFGVSGRCQ